MESYWLRNQVRQKASTALAQLMPLTSRVDAVLQELCSAASQAESVAIRASVFEAIGSALSAGERSLRLP